MLCSKNLHWLRRITYLCVLSNDFLFLCLAAGEEGPWALRESIQQHLQGNRRESLKGQYQGHSSECMVEFIQAETDVQECANA